MRTTADWGIWHWLERRADLSPRKPALILGTRSVDYRTLADRVAALASALRDRGVGRGDRMAILSQNRIEFVEVLFAAARLGAMAVPLNWRLTAAELAFQVGDSRPAILFVDPAVGSLATALLRKPEARTVEAVIVFDEPAGASEEGVALGEGQQQAVPPGTVPYSALLASPPGAAEGRPDDPLLILYTSGTTGRPKGAVLTQATQFWNSINIGTGLSLVGRDVTLNVLPMFHSGGIGLLTLPSLHVGATAVLLPRFHADAVVREIASRGITAMFAVPTMYLALLEHPGFRALDLRRVRFSCGGAPCPLSIIEFFRDRGVLFQQGYGLTETSPTFTLLPAEDAFRKAGSVGKATLHTALRVVDEAGRDVAPGEVGEVWAAGPNLFSGYWERPEETAEAFADGWFRTGDLARVDEEGFVYIVDRKTDLIISGGENIYPAEVEAILSRHPAVAEVAVIGVPDPRWGEVPMAVVVPRPGQRVTLADLQEFCEGRLARYKIPKALAVVDTLPRNAAGKVLKRLLRQEHGAPGEEH